MIDQGPQIDVTIPVMARVVEFLQDGLLVTVFAREEESCALLCRDYFPDKEGVPGAVRWLIEEGEVERVVRSGDVVLPHLDAKVRLQWDLTTGEVTVGQIFFQGEWVDV